MRTFLGTVSYMMPYPILKEYRTEASGFHTAAARMLKEWRKDNKRKKVKQITIKIVKV